MTSAKPKKTVHRAVGFVAVRKVKEPRIVWQELQARGAKSVAYAQCAVGDRLVGIAGNELVFADATGLHTTKLEPGDWDGLALRDDGGATLVFAENTVVEVAIPSGEASALATGAIDGLIEGVCYALDHVVLLVKRKSHELVLAARNGTTLNPVATLAQSEFVFGIGGRSGVVVVATNEQKTSRVLIVRHGAFRDAGAIKQAVNTVQTCGEQLLVSGMPGTFEVDLEALE
jgi:hypothetical protein